MPLVAACLVRRRWRTGERHGWQLGRTAMLTVVLSTATFKL